MWQLQLKFNRPKNKEKNKEKENSNHRMKPKNATILRLLTKIFFDIECVVNAWMLLDRDQESW